MTEAEWIAYRQAVIIVRQLGERLREFQRYGRPRHYLRHRLLDFLWRLFQ